jgi:hypothetical protein
MNREEKIKQLNSRLKLLDSVIKALEQGIAENPNADIEGKRPRAEVLNDYVLQKQALILFKETL